MTQIGNSPVAPNAQTPAAAVTAKVDTSQAATTEQAESKPPDSVLPGRRRRAKAHGGDGEALSLRPKKQRTQETRVQRSNASTPFSPSAPTTHGLSSSRPAYCRETKQFEKALESIGDALVKRPGDQIFILQKALVEFDQEQFDAALQTLAPITSGEKLFPMGRLLQAKCLVGLGDEAGALSAIENAVDLGYVDIDTLETETAFLQFQNRPRVLAIAQRISATLGHSPEAVPVVSDNSIAIDVGRHLGRLLRARNDKSGWKLTFKAKDLDGKPFDIASYRGKPLLVMVCGSWSVTSWSMLKTVQAMKAKYAAEGLEVVLLSWENNIQYAESGPFVKSLLEKEGIKLRCALVEPRHFKEIYINGIPLLYFVSADGVVRHHASGKVDAEGIEALTELHVRGRLPKPPTVTTTDTVVPLETIKNE